MTEYDDRIDQTVERTDKVMLTCVNHPDLRWMTKNISHIGARSIFFRGSVTDERPAWPFGSLDLVKLTRNLLAQEDVTQEKLVALVTDTVHAQKHYVVECSCPMADLIVVSE
jgi:hypothetical protein